MKKLISIFSYIIISLFILAIFGWMVNQISTKNKKFGFLTEPIKFMYSFPDLFEESVQEVKRLPKTFLHTYEKFEKINRLDKDLIVLTSFSENDGSRTVALINLRNDSILRTWNLENPWGETGRIINPIYQEHDGSLIYHYYYHMRPGMYKIDANGNEQWNNDSLVMHHGMNLNNEGDIWVCTIYPGKASGNYTIDGRSMFYNDYRITKYCNQTGEIIFDKSITAILRENNLANYLLKSAETDEPLHLNDVQPALKTTRFYEEDDVFISLRNIHCILHYRPTTNKLIRLIEGPFINQHDVDFLNDSTLAIFNNNTFVDMHVQNRKAHTDTSRLEIAGSFYSNIVTYDFKNEEFEFVGDSIFRTNKIFTKNEGLMEFLDDETFFVEEQNQGLLWVLKQDEVIYKNVQKSQYEGHHHLPNWTRVITYGDRSFR